MGTIHQRKGAFATVTFLILAVMTVSARSSAQTEHNGEFVRREGGRLTLGGETFRYSGPNIEWLGLEGYGPLDPAGPHYPSHFEVDDALDTAKMMGARVVRSQTMGDSIDCDLCIEPKLGEFNQEAFRQLDYVLKAAHDRGLRLVVTLVGDCAFCKESGAGEYFKDRGAAASYRIFFSDPAIIARFEKHIEALLNHKNSLTGVVYKDDPTIMAWEDCNACAYMVAMTGGDAVPLVVKWVDTIGAFVKSIDKKHLYQEDSGIFQLDKSGAVLDSKTADIITSGLYPHWQAFAMGEVSTADTSPKQAETVTSHGKVFVVNEFGWDVTDWATPGDLEKVLTAMTKAPKISGDLYWALQAHLDKFGWQPIPANVPDVNFAKRGETGQWWALYYGGINTVVMTKEDMATRAELLRTHGFEMAGVPVPPHTIPPTPVLTSSSGVVTWRGSAGAVKYSIERKDNASSSWQLVCDKCATDADTPWVDPKPPNIDFSDLFGTKYRVTAYNADGHASAPSPER